MKKNNANNIIMVNFIILLFLTSCNKNNNIEYFYTNDNKIEKKIYHFKEYDSVITFYSTTNNLKEVFCIKNGLKNGIYIQYYNDSNKILGTEANYDEGIRNGKYMNFHKDGRIAWDLTYDRGFLIKQVVFGYNNDTMALITNQSKVIQYRNNVPDTIQYNK